MNSGRTGPATDARDDRGDRWKVRRFGLTTIESDRHGSAPREHHVVTDRVFVVRMRERPDERPLVAARGEQREMLANKDTRCPSGNRREFTAHAFRGFRLGIETVMLRQSPGEKDVNDRFGTRRCWRDAILGCQPPQACQVIHAQSQQADRPDLQGRAARELWMSDARSWSWHVQCPRKGP